MGRTNPTYRDWLQSVEAEWQPFRRALRRTHQEDFDRLFERAADFADAAGHANSRDPELALVLSVLLAHEVELRELREAVGAADAGEGPDAGEAGDAAGAADAGETTEIADATDDPD